MPKKNGRNNQPPSDGDVNHIDTSDCSFCANGLQCPYWFQDTDGNWWHDTSGAKGYLEDTVITDRYNQWKKLPDTPGIGGDQDSKGKPKPKRDDDDDDTTGRKRFRLF